VSIDNTAISQVKSSKFLGVYVDEHLTWKEHIKNISTKIAKNIGILSRISYLLPRNILINLYYSLIYPYLAYCNIAWASTYHSRLKRLIVLQKRAVRIIAGSSFNSHTNPIFHDFNILPVEQINKLQISEFMFRFTHNLLPCAFAGYFSSTSDLHDHNTRSRGAYRGNFARTNSRLFSIKCVGPSVWNSLSHVIRSLPNLSSFKKSVRAYLIDQNE